MNYTTFDNILRPAVQGATVLTVDDVAGFGKGVADALLAGGNISQDQHNIVYHNIDGWKKAFHDGTTPPAWEIEEEPL